MNIFRKISVECDFIINHFSFSYCALENFSRRTDELHSAEKTIYFWLYEPRDFSSMKVSSGEDQMGPCKNPIKESNTQALSSLSFISPRLCLASPRNFAHLRRVSPLQSCVSNTSLLTSCSHSYDGQNMSRKNQTCARIIHQNRCTSLLSVSIVSRYRWKSVKYVEYFNIYLGKYRTQELAIFIWIARKKWLIPAN